MTQSKRVQGRWGKIVIQSALGLILLSAPALFWAGSRSLEKTHSVPKNPQVLAAPGLPTAPGQASDQDALSKAQAKLPTSALPIDQIIEQVHFAFRPQDSGYQGTHSTYRVQVSEDGAWKFTPYRYQSPSEAKAGAPLELETTSISRGDKATPAQALLVHSDEKAELDIERNQATEHLRNQKEGVEQSWSFTHPPQGQGDLVLRIRAAGLAYAGQTEQGLHFSDPDSGMGVRYGAATWIDAHGARTSVSPSRVGDQIELRVPSRVIEQSAYPAVLDPVVGPELSVDQPLPAPAFRSHSELSMAQSILGYFLVWTSRENGQSHVYGTRLSLDGHTVLDPAGIALFPSSANQDSPKVATFGGTGYMIVWRDYRNGKPDIYGTRVGASTGQVLDPSSIAISQRPEPQSRPTITANGSTFFVAWQVDTQATGSDIYGARINGATGALIDPQPVVISNAPGNQTEPSVSSGWTDYYVVWTDERNGPNADIYGTQISHETATVASPEGLAISQAEGRQSAPQIAASTGGFGESSVVIWQDDRNGVDLDLYAVRWPGSTAPFPSTTGMPVVVHSGNQSAPTISCVNQSDRCLMLWDDDRSGAGHEVYFRRYQMTLLGPTGPAEGTRLSSGPSSTPVSGVVGTSQYDAWENRFLVLWTGASSEQDGISSTLLDIDGDSPDGETRWLLGPDRDQQTPSVAFDGTNYLVVWTDQPNSFSDLYGARLRGTDGALLDPGGITISAAPNQQLTPAATFDGTHFWVTWADYRIGTNSGDIYAARIDSNGTVLDPNGIAISPNGYGQYDPAIAAGSNTVLVVWNDGRTGSNFGLYGARLRSDGQVLDPQGIEIAQRYDNQMTPSVAFDGSRYLVVWEDIRTLHSRQIYGARLDEAQGTVLDPLAVPVTNTAGDRHDPVVAFGNNEYLVVWTDSSRPENTNIWATRVSPDLHLLSTRPISEAPNRQMSPSIAWTGHQYIVSWTDNRAGSQYDIYAARVNADGALQDPQGILVSSVPSDKLLPKVASGLTDSALIVYTRQHSEPEAGPRVQATLLSPLAETHSCATTGDCVNGTCVDGYCCDSPCTGQCEACNVPGSEGFCTAIQGVPHGQRPGCQGSGLCQASCDGTHVDSCVYPGNETSCAPGSCMQGFYQAPSSCDGQGRCIAPSPVSCGPYNCGQEQCNQQCQNAQDCAPGSNCQNGVCLFDQDAGADAQADAQTDASSDATADGAPNPEQDAGPDALSDAQSDGNALEASTHDAQSGLDGALGSAESLELENEAGCGCQVPGSSKVPAQGAGIISLLGLGLLLRRRDKRQAN